MARVDTPGKEQQMLLAGAAVSELCLAEKALGANMLGDFGQVPECLWANFSGRPNGNNPTACCTFSYRWRA